MHTVSAVYSDKTQAESAIAGLQAAGVPSADISLDATDENLHTLSATVDDNIADAVVAIFQQSGGSSLNDVFDRSAESPEQKEAAGLLDPSRTIGTRM